MSMITRMFIVASLLYSSLFTSVMAQNVLFIPFGQNEEEVRGFVDENVILSTLNIDQKETQILVSDSLRSMSYEFHDNGLYKITDTRVFSDYNQAKRVVDAVLNYMRLFNRDVANPKKEELFEHYVVVGDTKIVEVHIEGFSRTSKSNRPVTIKLTSTGKEFAPEEEVNYLTALFN